MAERSKKPKGAKNGAGFKEFQNRRKGIVSDDEKKEKSDDKGELYEPEKREADCFTVDSMIEIPEDKIDKFITVSNEKPLRVSSKARIPFIYVKAEKDIEL